jgi:hypothetical protein
MSRPAGSAFPDFMFRTNPRTWAAPVVEEPKVAPPPAAGNRQTTSSRTAGATGSADPTVQKLGFGGTRRKGRKLSKKRRLTHRRRRR